MLSAGMPLFVLADSKDTEQKLNEAKDAAQDTKDAIDANEDNIDALGDTKNALEGQLADLNTQLSDAAARLSDIESQISVKNDEIADKQNEITVKEEEIAAAQQTADEQYAAMKKRIQFMYEKGQNTWIEILLSSGSFSELLNRANYIRSLSAYDRKMLTEYQNTVADLKDKKAKLEAEQAALEEDKEALGTLKADASAEKSNISGLVSQTSGNIQLTQDQLDAAAVAADQLGDILDAQNAQIAALEKQLAQERALEQQSQASAWRSLGDVTFEEGDRKLLANIIYCEAGNQGYEGQLAVGAVIMNRVMSGAFPNTIAGVIYQSRQFSPVGSGRFAVALAEDAATRSSTCYQAADDAMAGKTNVDDCIFFRTPIPEVTPRFTIGAHVFYGKGR